MMTIYFDMDGTIADLYGVENWLDMLMNSDPSPYRNALPLININELNSKLEAVMEAGYEIGIVSWLSKNSSDEYNKAVRLAKKEWISKNISIKFSEIHIVKYGTPKSYVVKDKMGILFDDEEKNRNQWKGTAYEPSEILRVLEALL